MEYSTPKRVRWDIDFEGRSGRAKRIARRIREASPLDVEVRIEGKKGLSEFPAVFTEIHKGNSRVEATLPLSPEAISASRWGYPMEFLWEVSSGKPFDKLLPPDAESISFQPDEEGLSFLPEILEEFAESGLRTLRLPNVSAVRSLASKGHVPFPGAAVLREAGRNISALRISLAGKKLVTCDYFLWKMLREIFPEETGGKIEFTGCRAAAEFAYVDWEGNVYPCDALPIRLGNLQESSFEKIWKSPARIRVLEAIRSMPTDCEPCEQKDSCFSGCRGLAYSSSGTLDAPDPSCPGRFPPK